MLFLDRRNQIIDIRNAYPAFRYEMEERRSIHTPVFPFMLQNYPKSDSWNESGGIIQVSHSQNHFCSFFKVKSAVLPEDQLISAS